MDNKEWIEKTVIVINTLYKQTRAYSPKILI